MDALVQFYQKKFSYLRMVFEHNTTTWKLSQAIGSDIRALRKVPPPAAPPKQSEASTPPPATPPR